jgi:hypothetical protein
LVRWKPPEKRYSPCGQRAVAVAAPFRRTKTVLWGDECGTSPRAQITWSVARRAVVLFGDGSMTTVVTW